MFVDRVKIRIRAGNGGHGCLSFLREPFRPHGGPDGGDGGHGGDVVVAADVNLQSLAPHRYRQHYEAGNGQPGMGKNRHGQRGADVIINVPPGTLIFDLDHDGETVADLASPTARVTVARGGRGGRGNARFSSSVNQAPRHCEEGKPGEERYLELELKTIADVGLVGYPNAGKSSFLAAVSNARPEIASYPFTTLAPHVGIVEGPQFQRMTIADIPGLVDNAHRDVGLGHDFLRHIERTRVLAYVIDAAATDGRQPWNDLAALQRELECYREGMSRRPALVIANKMDEAAAAENIERLRTHTGLPVFPVCALLGENVGQVIDQLRFLLRD